MIDAKPGGIFGLIGFDQLEQTEGTSLCYSACSSGRAVSNSSYIFLFLQIFSESRSVRYREGCH